MIKTPKPRAVDTWLGPNPPEVAKLAALQQKQSLLNQECKKRDRIPLKIDGKQHKKQGIT